MNISLALRNLFPTVNGGVGPLPGIDYKAGWSAPVKGQTRTPILTAWTPTWPLVAPAVYPPQPTVEQLTVALQPSAQQTFDAAVAAGYTVPGVTPPLVLDLGDGARATFTGLMVLINSLMSSGQLLATSTQTITGNDGTPRSLPVSQIEAILVGYGLYYANLFNALHSAAVEQPAAPAAATVQPAVAPAA